MNGYAIAAALVLGGLVATSAAAWFGAAAKPQPLAELGTVAVPGRLDPYAADEADGYTVFSFDHTPGSIFAYLAVIPPGQHFAVLGGVLLGAVASFLVGALILRINPVREEDEEGVAVGGAAVPGLGD